MENQDVIQQMFNALVSTLNLEGVCKAGETFPAFDELDVSWHFEKVRDAIKRGIKIGCEFE